MQLSPPLLISCNLFPDPFHLRPQKGNATVVSAFTEALESLISPQVVCRFCPLWSPKVGAQHTGQSPS